jgi:hypothetical protein
MEVVYECMNKRKEESGRVLGPTRGEGSSSRLAGKDLARQDAKHIDVERKEIRTVCFW